MPTSWPSLIQEPSGLMMIQVFIGKIHSCPMIYRKHSVVKSYTKTRCRENFWFCLFIPSPALKYTSKSFFLNNSYLLFSSYVSSFSVAKANILSGTDFWFLKYIKELGETEKWVYFLEWVTEGHDKEDKYIGPSFSSRGRKRLKKLRWVILQNASWRADMTYSIDPGV